MTHQTSIRLSTAKLIGKLTDSGLISLAEHKEIVGQFKHLALKGSLIPVITPKLIDQRDVAEMLGIGLSNFK